MFTVHRTLVRDGLQLAFVREGVGGYPLLLVHGYPETKRIWWRNIEPLARSGFEVIVPDLRGYGDSDLAPDGFYDPAAFATDLYTLVHDVLGHEECAAAGGDLGGVVVQELSLRFAPFVSRQCLFNTVVPELGDVYRDAGVDPDPDRSMRPTADYFLRQGRDADGLIAELDTPERRRSYVADFYGHRLWAARGTFKPDDIDFMTEPFAAADHLRASWGAYEVACGARQLSEVPRLFEKSDVPTLVLYGPDDHVVWPNFPQKCAVAFTDCIGPFVVPGAGHFLQWEQAGVLNNALRYFLADLASKGTSQD